MVTVDILQEVKKNVYFSIFPCKFDMKGVMKILLIQSIVSQKNSTLLRIPFWVIFSNFWDTHAKYIENGTHYTQNTRIPCTVLKTILDDFNVKLLTPNLSKKQLEELHSDALKLYKDYLNKDSLNFIGSPDDITEDFCHLIKESYITEKLTKIPKLLYRAYDYTFTELETMWLPQFFHSNEVNLLNMF